MTPTTVSPRPFHDDVHAFAEIVGVEGPVAVVGGRTAWDVGGPPVRVPREVAAPNGIVELIPAEMTVRVGAGTPIDVLDAALAEVGQEVALEGRPGGTVGGAIAVGWSSLRRPRLGPSRDALLEAAVVGADGRLVRAGGPTVKNVTGYDLCRLLVGSLGTVGLVAEVLLRTRPRPATSVWVAGEIDPAAVPTAPLRPAAHLWDGVTTWICLEGHPDDVDPMAERLAAAGAATVAGPPSLPPHRWSVDPSRLAVALDDTTGWVAEVGVGTVHHTEPQPAVEVPAGVRLLHDRLATLFDPRGRLNPGRSPLVR